MKVELDLIDELEIGIEASLEKKLMESIEAVLQEMAIDRRCEVSLTLTDNENIKQLNQTYRNKNSETDVLSFPQYDILKEGVPKDPILYLGDIVISVEKAREQALDFGHSFEREMVYLTVHSMYHLMGYDHMEDSEKTIMREMEKKTLKKLGVFKEELM